MHCRQNVCECDECINCLSCGSLVLEKLKLYSSYEVVENAQEYLFRTSEIVLIKVETNFNFEGILTVKKFY